jgi:hypothetical protein
MTRVRTVEPMLAIFGTTAFFVMGISAVLVAWLFTV